MNSLSGHPPANIFRWEMWGILFIIVLGSFLHFTFELSGNWAPLGIVSSVNESVWEHFKQVFWPATFWTIIEYLFIRRVNRDPYPNFLLAKAAGAYVMPIVIAIIFYSYTAFTGDSILIVDVISFVIAVVIGQITSYRLWRSLKLPGSFNRLGLAMFIAGAIALAVLTFYPPEVGIFQDQETGSYGIQQ